MMTSDDYPTQSAMTQGVAAGLPDGLLLCGGRGRRAGGVDKGLLTIDGELAATRLLRLLQPLCGQVIISANRNLPRYRELGPGPVVKDLRPGYPGPLAALEAAAPQLRSELVLILPVDMPELSPEVPVKLLDGLMQRPALEVLYARTPDREHYLCAALRRRAVAAAGGMLDHGRHAVRELYAALHSDSLLFEDALAAGFRNRNDATDWPATTDDPTDPQGLR